MPPERGELRCEELPAPGPGKALVRTLDSGISKVTELVVHRDSVPARRAVLTGTVETAANGLWEAGPRLGDRVAVVGSGLVGGMVAKLLAGFRLTRLQLIDVDPAKRDFADALGVDFSRPDDALGDCDVLIYCSASQAGLERCLQLAGDDADVVEMSWVADRPVSVPFGEDFHARRLSIRASRVGVVANARRHRRTNADRLALAVELLRGPGFEVFFTGPPRSPSCPTSSGNSPRAACPRSATSSNTRLAPAPPALIPAPKPPGNTCSVSPSAATL
ncbi:hypothetical protein [Arthrobacter oryzae]|uniref:hypothetical protein n=1 Tax=Arthrobacter oryzae TaxID=409290 RepID=UPI0026C0A4BF